MALTKKQIEQRSKQLIKDWENQVAELNKDPNWVKKKKMQENWLKKNQ